MQPEKFCRNRGKTMLLAVSNFYLRVRHALSWYYILNVLRLLFYFSSTATWFVLSFLPLGVYLFYLLHTESLVFFLVLMLGLPFVYFLILWLFVIVHSQVVIRILPPLKPGTYKRSSLEGMLQGVRLSADSIAKVLIRPLFIVPFISQMWLLKFFFWFYGLRVGKGTYISITCKFDSALLEIGSDCFIGLDTVIACHINEGKYLYINKVKIGNNVTVGGKSIIAPGCIIGDNVIIAAHAIVPKDKIIPSNAVWVATKPRLLKIVNENNEKEWVE